MVQQLGCTDWTLWKSVLRAKNMCVQRMFLEVKVGSSVLVCLPPAFHSKWEIEAGMWIRSELCLRRWTLSCNRIWKQNKTKIRHLWC